MPDVSVVIPLYKAVSYLPGLLASLEAQTLPPTRFEVVLVDDASPDETVAVANGLKATSPLNLEIIARPNNGGVSATRNTGWQAARASLIVFIDQDCLADPDLLASHMAAHAAQPQTRLALAGRIVWSAIYRENPASEYFKASYFPGWAEYKADGPNFQLFITSNASVSRAGLEAAGGFDPAFRHNYDDVSLGHRLEQSGYRIELCPTALVYHNRPLPIAEMFRRTRLAGREMARFEQHYPELIGHWWLLNPAQAFDWADRLSNMSGLLAATLDKMPATELAAHQPLLEEAANYVLQNPGPHQADPLYIQTWLAHEAYQRDQHRAEWLEAAFKGRSKKTESKRWFRPANFAKRLAEALGDHIGSPLPRQAWPSKFGKGLSLVKRVKSSKPAEVVIGGTGKNKPQISVLACLSPHIAQPEWERFLTALSAQTLGPDRFELIVAALPRQTAILETRSVDYPVKVVTVADLSAGWVAASRLASGSLLVLLSADSVPASDLLETYGHYYRSDTALVGQELPLVKENRADAERLSPMNLFEPSEPTALHFSAYRLTNSALSAKLFRSVVPADFKSDLADLVTGWRIVEEQKGQVMSCPAAINNAYQPRRLAYHLLDYAQRPADLILLGRRYPALAALYDQLEPGSPEQTNLHLLYDTLKEYPFTTGLLDGLQTILGLPDLEAVKRHPLFSPLVARWEAQRNNLLRAQLVELQTGQVELQRYLRHLEQSLNL